MDERDRRAEKRVRPPGDAVLEFALWPTAVAAPARLALAELGPPAVSRRAGYRLLVADISAIGIGIELSAPTPAGCLGRADAGGAPIPAPAPALAPALAPAPASAPALTMDTLAGTPAFFLYLRLRDYRPQTAGELFSLFFHATAARITATPGHLFAGLRFVRQGRGSPFDKALEFLDVSRFGAPGLAAWIDAVVRDEHRPDHDPAPGVNLDRLLDEPGVSASSPTRSQDDVS